MWLLGLRENRCHCVLPPLSESAAQLPAVPPGTAHLIAREQRRTGPTVLSWLFLHHRPRRHCRRRMTDSIPSRVSPATVFPAFSASAAISAFACSKGCRSTISHQLRHLFGSASLPRLTHSVSIRPVDFSDQFSLEPRYALHRRPAPDVPSPVGSSVFSIPIPSICAISSSTIPQSLSVQIRLLNTRLDALRLCRRLSATPTSPPPF